MNSRQRQAGELLKLQEGSSSLVIFFIPRVNMLFYYALLL
jgi:hypothetical protein